MFHNIHLFAHDFLRAVNLFAHFHVFTWVHMQFPSTTCLNVETFTWEKTYDHMWNACHISVRIRKISSEVTAKISLDSVGLLIHCVFPFLRVWLIFLILIASQPYQPPSREQSTQSVSLSVRSIADCLRQSSPILKSLETTCTSIFSHVGVMANFFLGFQHSHGGIDTVWLIWHALLFK